MGCGLAHIAKHFSGDKRFQFTNYDHFAIDDKLVHVCDIACMPLEDDSVDICVMCLAMWGSNCDQYLCEAYRVLETNGSLIILDTTKRWSETNEQNYIEESMMGVKLKRLLEATGFKIVGEKMDKFCYFRCVK